MHLLDRHDGIKKKTVVIILMFLYFLMGFFFYKNQENIQQIIKSDNLYGYFLYAYSRVWPIANFVLVTWIMLLFDAKIEKRENIYLKHNSKDFFYRLFENIFWGRTSMYRNEHSGNVIFFNSLYIVSAWVCIILIFAILIFNGYEECNLNIPGKDVLIFYFAFMSLVATVYWKEREKYKEKWEYLCTLYNKYLEAEYEYECKCTGEKCKTKEKKIKLIRNAIAIDSIVILMWNHRSITSLVKEEIIIAMKELSCFSDDHKICNDIKHNVYSESEMIYVLEEYQKRILGKKCCDKCDLNSIDRCINFRKVNGIEIHKGLCINNE